MVATSSGADVVCCGDVAGRVMWLIYHFCSSKCLVDGAVGVEYDVRTNSGMSVWVMYMCHVGWTRVEDGVKPLGSLRCGVFAGSRSVVLRVSIHVRNWRSESCCPMFGSLANIASVFRMCNRVSDGEELVSVSIVLHLCVPVTHKGAKCLRNVFEY